MCPHCSKPCTPDEGWPLTCRASRPTGCLLSSQASMLEDLAREAGHGCWVATAWLWVRQQQTQLERL